MLSIDVVADMVDKCKANYRSASFLTPEELKTKAELWQEMFSNVKEDLFVTAVDLAILECEEFPNVANIRKSIKDLTKKDNDIPGIDDQEQKKQEWSAEELERAKRIAAQANQVVAQGRHKERLIESDNFTNAAAYARRKWPELSDERIYHGLCAIMEAMATERKCDGCRGSECPYAYCKTVLRLDSRTGAITTAMAKCSYHPKYKPRAVSA